MITRPTHVFTVYHVHARQPAWRPPTDVYETDSAVVAQIEVAGMRDGHFHISIHQRELVVYGTRVEAPQERRAYHQIEMNQGDFRTEIELPAPVAAANVRADYDDGILKIVIPKLQ